MSGKRTSTGSAAGPAQKRGRKDPVMAKCEMVVAALKRAGLDEAPFQCLSSAALAALPIAADVRHPFHERIFAMVSEELGGISDALGKRLSELQAREADLTEGHTAAAGELWEARVVQTRQEGEMNSLMLTLAETAQSLRSAKGLTAEAELNLESQELAKTIRDASALDEIVPLLEQPVPEEKAAELVQRLQVYVHMEESLAALAPKAIARAERHGIEGLAVQQLMDLVSRKRADLKAAIDADAVCRAGREKALVDAQEALRAAKQQLLEAANSFEASQAAVEASKHAADEAAKKLRDAAKGLKDIRAQRHDAEVEVELHRDHAIALLEELKARKTEHIPDAESQPTRGPAGEGLVAAAAAGA